MKVAFITKGGFEDGMGHIYSTLTLAKYISNGAVVRFFTGGDNIAIKKIRENNFEVIETKNIEEIIEKINKLKPDTIVVDLPLMSEEFIKSLKNKDPKAKLIVFGNILVNIPPNVDEYCDVVINYNFGSGNFESRKYIDKKTGTLFLQGPRYLILRPEFYNCKKTYRTTNLRRILIIFGGADPSNLTSQVLDKLLQTHYDFNIGVVLGPNFGFYNKIVDILERHKEKKERVKIYKDVENVATLMYNTDLVITSPGLSMFEALYIGVPTIAICQNNLQKRAYKDFTFVYDKQCIQELDKLVFTFYKLFPKIIDEMKIEIGDGKEEVIEEILEVKE